MNKGNFVCATKNEINFFLHMVDICAGNLINFLLFANENYLFVYWGNSHSHAHRTHVVQLMIESGFVFRFE